MYGASGEPELPAIAVGPEPLDGRLWVDPMAIVLNLYPSDVLGCIWSEGAAVETYGDLVRLGV